MDMRRSLLCLVLFLFLLVPLWAQEEAVQGDEQTQEQVQEETQAEADSPPAPPAMVAKKPVLSPLKIAVNDSPDDNGKALIVEWDHSPDAIKHRTVKTVDVQQEVVNSQTVNTVSWTTDSLTKNFRILGYEIMRQAPGEGEYNKIATAFADQTSYVDADIDPGESAAYSYKVVAHITRIALYEILRSENTQGPFISVGMNPMKKTRFTDSGVEPGHPFYYKVIAIDKDGERSDESLAPAKGMSHAQWFSMNKLNIFIILGLLSFFIIYSIERAKKDPDLYIRPIAGLAAVEEAIGRSTEMGKPTLFISGIMDMDDVQTIAGITILGQVAKMCAEYDTPILVPTCRSVVMTTAQEVVREAYLKAGRPDAFKQDNVWYMTDDQFGFAAGVDGLILRERPSAVFLLGRFYAESLILAETGNYVGAIQIAGTAEPSQLPFFVTACDYTLLGEELFAASAYLSRDPYEVGSLKGQDWGKLTIMLLLCVLLVLGILSFWPDSFAFSLDVIRFLGNLFKI